MDTVFAERPHFFEGQYLGADDLQTLLAYLREQARRHRLGAHTWGIVAGIEIASRSAADGSTELFLTPGIAVDGYGRLVAVLSPCRLDAALFALQPGGLVDVWLRYAEASAGGVRPGFETCGATDAYTRVSESFAVEVGPRRNLAQRESGVAVDDANFTDARDAPGRFLADDAPVPGGPVALDGSVPAQLFPNDDEPGRWLIPVGRVPWQAGSPGAFGALDEVVLKQSMMFRRQAGVVAESIVAANGLLRLRTRWVEREAGKTNDQLAQAAQPLERDLQLCHGRIEPTEPIWLEAATRLTGDLRLFGTRVEWQAAAGTDYRNKGVPFALRRRGDANPLKGQDLQLLLGQAVDGPNRFVIGRATLRAVQPDPCQLAFDFSDGVVVQDDAKVGIGTAGTALAQPLTIRPVGATGEALGLLGTDGKALAWRLNYGPKGNGFNVTHGDDRSSDLFIDATGNVGLGIAEPGARLEVMTGPGQPALPRLQWRQQGAPGGGGGPAPQVWSWIGHARPMSPDITIWGGAVGIGTLTPSRVLHVESTEIHSGGGGGGYSFANRETGVFVEAPANGERWVWYAGGGTARLWSGSDKLAVSAAGNVAVGPVATWERLNVDGNVRLGPGASDFAVGAPSSLHLRAGSVPASGNAAGAGWSAMHVGFGDSGQVRVNFAPAFAGTPVVTVTLVDPPSSDNVICVANVSATGFDVFSRDLDPTKLDGSAPQDAAFNFMAVGARA